MWISGFVIAEREGNCSSKKWDRSLESYTGKVWKTWSWTQIPGDTEWPQNVWCCGPGAANRKLKLRFKTQLAWRMWWKCGHLGQNPPCLAQRPRSFAAFLFLPPAVPKCENFVQFQSEDESEKSFNSQSSNRSISRSWIDGNAPNWGWFQGDCFYCWLQAFGESFSEWVFWDKAKTSCRVNQIWNYSSLTRTALVNEKYDVAQ